MRFRLNTLHVVCRKRTEEIEFADVSAFYGKIGAGKSSIAMLVDFCLGGRLKQTPAIQEEFVEATLDLQVADVQLSLTRARATDIVRASWESDDGPIVVSVPARRASGTVLPDTEVEVLSDLVFYLAGIKIPRVRKSKIKSDSELGRLSLRDLFWYCYLEQASMEATFFHLDGLADFGRRLKSQDVLRYVLGFHHEKLAELELELDQLRLRKRALLEGARSLRQALDDAGVASRADMELQIDNNEKDMRKLEEELSATRRAGAGALGHGTEQLRATARSATRRLHEARESLAAVERVLAEEKRHHHELQMVTLRFTRSAGARAVLRGVDFKTCPRCTQALPPRAPGHCNACGQMEPDATGDDEAIAVARQDAKDRLTELSGSIARHLEEANRHQKQIATLEPRKRQLDEELSAALTAYDSQVMSAVVAIEKQLERLRQEQIRLRQLLELPTRADSMVAESDALAAEQQRIEREIHDARAAAEKDSSNLQRLEELFLDCLLRSRLPGVAAADSVRIDPRDFYPKVLRGGDPNSVVTDFLNLSSGGKTTVFKSCFAVALHRLAAQIDAPLPTLLIIDTPMKNISERTDREIFHGFYGMIYELADSELADTQFVLIDKEYRPPEVLLRRTITDRYMTPNDDDHPPLISYYRERESQSDE